MKINQIVEAFKPKGTFFKRTKKTLRNKQNLVLKRRGIVADITIEATIEGYTSKLLGADIGCTQERELTRVQIRVNKEEVVADGEAQNSIAHEL